MAPYRGELVRVEPRSLVAEPEKLPRGVSVCAWSDGTLRMRLRAPQLRRRAALFGAGVALVVGAAVVALATDTAALAAGVPFGGALVFFALYDQRTDVPIEGEELEVTPAAVSWRRGHGGSDVRSLDEVRTVVVTGDGANARLDLQIGRERLRLADGFGYDEATLRWIAQRLRRALEAARSR